MELRELLRRLGRRLWILIIIPIVAVAVVAAVAAQEPPKYAATATVSVSAPSGQEGTSSINQAVGSLTSAAISQGVLATTAESAGVSVKRLESGINISRVATSELVSISYTDTDRATVTKVINTLPKEAQQAVFSTSLRQAQTSDELAQKAFDTATSKVLAVQKETGLILPDQQYQAKASEVTQLRVALVSAKTRPDTQSTTPLSDALAKSEKELAALLGKVGAFDQPAYELDRARTNLATTQTALIDVQSRQATAESATLVGVVTEQPRSTDVVRRSISAALIGLGIGVLLLVLSELLRRSRRRSDDELVQTSGRASERRPASANV